MPREDETPKLGDLVRRWVYGRYGVGGLVVLALAGAAFFIWSQWSSVRTWPGISIIVAHLDREALPEADPRRYSVAVANLDGDTANRNHKTLILRLLREFEGIQVLGVDRVISLAGSVPEEQKRQGHRQARAYLKETGAEILIWGAVLRHGNQTRPDLYLTAAGNKLDRSKQYAIESGVEFRLPQVFWNDLSDILGLVVTTQAAQFHARSGHYVADRLEPFIARVQHLLATGAGRLEWDAEALASTRVILADALQTFGDQSGRNEPLEEAIAAYREALEEVTRERVPLDWAGTQNNLGLALARLGRREDGTERLERFLVCPNRRGIPKRVEL